MDSNIVQVVRTSEGAEIFIKNGITVYAMELLFSHDGVTNWEQVYSSAIHPYQYDKNVDIPGHLWMKFRAMPTDEWSEPIKWVGEDGNSVDLIVENSILIKVNLDGTRESLYDLTTLEGKQGIQGVAGAGVRWDRQMFYKEMTLWNPLNTPTAVSGGACCAPVPSEAYPSTATLVFVLGDNATHTIVAGDYAGAQFHKATIDDIWTPTTGLNLDDEVYAYGYDGADPLTAEYAHLENDLLHKGKIFAWSGTDWIFITSIATPTFMLAPSQALSTSGMFMDAYVLSSTTIELSGTHTLNVMSDSIEPKHFKSTTFGRGIDTTDPLLAPKIKPSDFSGETIDVKTLSGEEVISVKTTVLYSDGLTTVVADVNGEVVNKFIVKASDLINAAGAIGTITGTGGFEDFIVLTGGVIKISGNKVIAESDELTITSVDTGLKLKLIETNHSTLGVMGKHIHKNAYNELKGLIHVVGDNSVGVNVNSDSFEYHVTTGQISIKESGILPKMISTTAINEGLSFNAQGQISVYFDTDHFATTSKQLILKDNGITSAKIAADQVVKSIQVSGVNYKNDVIFLSTAKDAGLVFDPGGANFNNKFTKLDFAPVTVGNTAAGIKATVSLDYDALVYALENTSQFLKIGGVAATWGTMAKGGGGADTAYLIQDRLDLKVSMNAAYGAGNNTRIAANNDIYMRPSDQSLSEFKMTIDENGFFTSIKSAI